MEALIFDLDGTLIDSVYPHTLAWQRALRGAGIECAAQEIHRCIGMSGKLLVKSIMRRRNMSVTDIEIDQLERNHAAAFRDLSPSSPPLPGAVELLAYLASLTIPHGIATSGKISDVTDSLLGLKLSADTVVVDSEMIALVKPEPDLFLACQDKLDVDPDQCVVVGDAVWDVHAASRAGILSVGLLSGGYGEQELYNAGAMRVYKNAAALLLGINELGFE